MKYAVDRIIDDIVVLENIETKEKKEVNIANVPKTIKEKNILIYINGKYIIDKEEEKIRTLRIIEKLNKLKNIEKIDKKRG